MTVLERAYPGAGPSGRNTGTLLNQAEPEVMMMKAETVAVYRELERGGFSFALQEWDQLLLARDDVQLEQARLRAEAVSLAGIDSHHVSAAEIHAVAPVMSPDLAGGYVTRSAWTLDARAATAAFAVAARAHGAEFRCGVDVVALERNRESVTGAVTSAGRVAADAVVLSTGAWLYELAWSIPVSAGRGWLLRTGALPARLPWIVEEISWPDQIDLGRGTRSPTVGDVAGRDYARPAAEAFVVAQQPAGDALLGASLAPSLSGAVEAADIPERIAARALAIAPGLRETPVLAAWSAHRPMTPDGLPVVGELAPGLFVNSGHGSLGMQAAPATSRWLASTILGEPVRTELVALTPGRFS